MKQILLILTILNIIFIMPSNALAWTIKRNEVYELIDKSEVKEGDIIKNNLNEVYFGSPTVMDFAVFETMFGIVSFFIAKHNIEKFAGTMMGKKFSGI